MRQILLFVVAKGVFGKVFAVLIKIELVLLEI